MSRSKTEYLKCPFSGNTTPEAICIGSTPIPTVDKFKYLGSMITADANIDADVAHRVNVAWQKWRSLTGVLCDPRMPVKTKGKVYKTAVRPALLYGSECWTVKKTHEQKVHVNEIKMLRWAGGVTRVDRVRNELIRGSFKVTPITDKMTESRLRWYGHVMRRDDDHVVKIALKLPEPKRGRGRPPSTWWSNIERDLKKAQLPKQTTQDRRAWRRNVRRPDPR